MVVIAEEAGWCVAADGAPALVPQLQKRELGSVFGENARIVRRCPDRDGPMGSGRVGIDSYTGIRDMIGRELDSARGEVSLDDLIHSLVRRFSIAEKSVIAYAWAAPHEVRGGVVRRQTVAVAPRKEPCDTRRLFRNDDGWLYRLRITDDHLRGSGFPVPVGVAALVGCAPGGDLRLDSRLGPQHVRWTGTQPSVGTVRRFLEGLGVGGGELVFLRFGRDHSFDIERTTDPLRYAKPLQQALALVGADSQGDAGDALAALARAACLPPTVDAVTVLGTYTGTVAIKILLSFSRLPGTTTLSYPSRDASGGAEPDGGASRSPSFSTRPSAIQRGSTPARDQYTHSDENPHVAGLMPALRRKSSTYGDYLARSP